MITSRLGSPPSNLAPHHYRNLNHHQSPQMTNIFGTALFWPWSHQFFPHLPPLPAPHIPSLRAASRSRCAFPYSPPKYQQVGGSGERLRRTNTRELLVGHKWFKLTVQPVQTRGQALLINLSWETIKWNIRRVRLCVTCLGTFFFSIPFLFYQGGGLVFFHQPGVWNYELLTTRPNSQRRTWIPNSFSFRCLLISICFSAKSAGLLPRCICTQAWGGFCFWAS